MSLLEATRRVALMKDGSLEDFLKLSRNCTVPVVIDRAMGDWNARTAWNISYFRSRFGDAPVRVSTSRDGVFRGDPQAGFSRVIREMPLKQYLDIIESGKTTDCRYYLQQLPLAGPFAQLLEDVRTPRYTGAARPSPHLWVGPEGNVSPLHFDLAHNLLTQVSGRKHLLLFSPTQTPLLYPFPRHSRIPNMSQVEVGNPDLVRFPKFSQAQSQEVTLEEGQMLFMPILWWHHVTSLSASISVNFWWTPNHLAR